MSKRIIDYKEIFKIAIKRGLEKPIENCNYNHCVTNDTKLVIIGTITPPIGKGFFYTAPRNKMFARIDKYYGTQENGLQSMKKQLTCDLDQNKLVIEQLKIFLKERKIAFLDVMKYAIRKNGKENSALDADIEFCYLDCDLFEKLLKERNDLMVICNSLEAYRRYNSIKEEKKLPSNAEYIPQKIWYASKEKMKI